MADSQILTKTDVREELFVAEYLIDLNASRAARACGITDENAGGVAAKILRRSSVQQMIRDEVAKRKQDLTIDAITVLREIAALGYSNIVDFIDVKKPSDLKNLPREVTASIQSIEWEPTRINELGEQLYYVKMKLYPKTPALEALAKYLGLLQPDAAPSGAVVNNTQVNIIFQSVGPQKESIRDL